jgi:anti-sigma factor RsiW
MRHPDEGRTLALLDGELDEAAAAELRSHLARCPACGALAERIARAARRSARALALLEEAPVSNRSRSLEARDRVQARLAGERGPASARRAVGWGRGWWVPLTLPRAAGIVLLLTGTAAAAVPGSPLREWIVRGWEGLRAGHSPEVSGMVEGGTEEGAGARTTPATQPTPPETGATLLPDAGGVELWIQEVPARAEVTVVFLAGDRAGVFAGAGTSYRTGSGRLEASGPPGPVRVELPRGAARAEVRVNGQVVLRRTAAGTEVLGEVARRAEGAVVFVARPPGGSHPNVPRPEG